jgi:hypothetical protein
MKQNGLTEAAREIAKHANLSNAAQTVLLRWLECLIRRDVNLLEEARKGTLEIIAQGIERIALPLPLMSAGIVKINALVVSPCYDAYAKPPELPLFFPAILEAGVGPYASGQHLILSFDKLALGEQSTAAASRGGFEFLHAWELRLSVTLPALFEVADIPMRKLITALKSDSTRLKSAVFAAILHHERGHAILEAATNNGYYAHAGQWCSTLTDDPWKVACRDAISDLQADLTLAAEASDETLVLTLAYQLYNLRHASAFPPTLDFGQPGVGDPDFLAGIFLCISSSRVVRKSPGWLNISFLRVLLEDLRLLLNTVFYSGDPRSVNHLLEESRFSPLWQIAQRIAYPTRCAPQKTFELPMQQQLADPLGNLVSQLSI